MQVAQGDLAGALKSYRDSLAQDRLEATPATPAGSAICPFRMEGSQRIKKNGEKKKPPNNEGTHNGLNGLSPDNPFRKRPCPV